jgi:hypothetical protein
MIPTKPTNPTHPHHHISSSSSSSAAAGIVIVIHITSMGANKFAKRTQLRGGSLDEREGI